MAGPVVETRYGSVRGTVTDGVVTFYDIPFAASPAGPGRFRPPAPPAPWSGVREADSPGPIAPQPSSLLGGYVPGDPKIQDEACLSLNVFTPALDDARRPVLVFVHGGAFMIGTGGGVMYHGAGLARRGVVVVTFNYRLGALGFLAHPDLADVTGEVFGNWGLLDQIAALEFVRDHAGAFGGDQGNVTLFGESAGAMSAAVLLATPRAIGLFRRAILQSGAAIAMTVDAAARNAEMLVGALGHDRIDRRALEQVPVEDLLTAQATLLGDLGVGASIPLQPVIDGLVVPESPAVVLESGGGNVEALVVGTNRDEFRFFTIGQRSFDDRSDDDLVPLVEAYLPSERGSIAREVIRKYRQIATSRGEHPSARRLFESIAGDAVFWVPAMRLASASAEVRPTFVYRFDWESPFMGGSLGACHGLELPFVFGTTTNPFVGLFSGSGAEADVLADAIQSAWVAFATDGDPGTESASWPVYDLRNRRTVLFAGSPGAVDAPREEERLLWEEIHGQYGESRL